MATKSVKAAPVEEVKEEAVTGLSAYQELVALRTSLQDLGFSEPAALQGRIDEAARTVAEAVSAKG